VSIRSHIADEAGHWSVGNARHPGWTAGVGVEAMLSPNIIVGLDYSHIRADARTHFGPVNGVRPAETMFYAAGVRAESNMLVARFSYMLGSGYGYRR
jgi:opacity protein-like surface antigen